MAQEIYYTRRAQANGRESVHVCYVFPVSPRVTDAGGNVVKWNYLDIPSEFAGVVSAAQKTSMEAGDTGFVTASLDRTGGETLAALQSRTRLDYDALAAYEIAEKRAKANETGSYNLQRGVIDR